MKSREHVVTNGKAAFYTCIWPDLREAALNCGWALGLHGSLANDMDIMAMPWTEDAKPVEEMIKALSDCFTESPFKEHHIVPFTDKPHGRVCYTMSIWADFHLDISVINHQINKPKIHKVYKCRLDEQQCHDECHGNPYNKEKCSNCTVTILQ